MKVRSPEKFMDVCDEKVTDEDGFLSSSVMIKARNTLMKERIWINRVASEFVFQHFIQTRSVAVSTVREEHNLHLTSTC